MRTWTADDPKAGLMARKRDLILKAALAAFLEDGYAGSSVNRIAENAGVSIKTLYRHFDNKDDLFVAVIQTACKANQGAEEPPWLDLPPLEGLTQAGSEHLAFVLSPEQIALYRVVTGEAQRFPELGQRYQAPLLEATTRDLREYRTELSERQKRMVGTVRSSAAALMRIIDDGMSTRLHRLRDWNRPTSPIRISSCSCSLIAS